MVFPKYLSPVMRSVVITVSVLLIVLGLIVGVTWAQTGDLPFFESEDDKAESNTDIHMQNDADSMNIQIENSVESQSNKEYDLSDDMIEGTEFESTNESNINVELESLITPSDQSNESNGSGSVNGINVNVNNGDYEIDVTGDGEVKKEVTQTEDGTEVHVEYTEESDNSRSHTEINVSQSSE